MNTKKQKSLKVTWAVSYLLIFSIPLFSNLLVNFYTRSIFEKSLVSSSEMFLDYIIQTTNSSLSEAEFTVKITKELPGLEAALNLKPPLDQEGERIIANLASELKKASDDYGFKNSPYIYLSRTDRVVSRSGVETFGKYFSDMKQYLGDNTSAITWRAYLTESPMVKIRQSSGQMIFYSSSVGKPSSTEFFMPGCIIIQSDFLKGTQAISQGYDYVVLDRYNTPIAYSQTLYKRKIFKNYDPENDSFIVINGEKYLIKQKSDSQSGYTYISMIGYSRLTSSMSKLETINFIIIILSVLVGIAFITYTLRRNYNPIKDAVSNLTQHTNEKAGAVNELTFIKDSISKLLNENSEISLKLDAQQDALRMHEIASLLKISYKNTIPPKLEFKHSNFAVAVFYIEEYGEYFSKSETVTQRENNYKLARFAIRQTVCELFENKGVDAYYTEMEDLIVFILCLPDEAKAEPEILNTAREYLEENLKIKITVSLSGTCSRTDGIANLYLKCLDLLDYRAISGKYTVITENYRGSINTTYNFSSEEEGLLKNYILQGNSQGAQALVSHVLHSSADAAGNPDILRYITFDIVSTILKVCNIDSKNQGYIDKLHNFLKWKDFPTAYHELSELISEACTTTNDRLPYYIVTKAIDYIESNYSNYDLSVSMIADRLGITPSYLSNTFVKNQNEKLLDYINRYRIERSKELLCDPKLTVAEVSSMVGYSNVKTFRRLFKKHAHILPAEYKKIKGQADDSTAG